MSAKISEFIEINFWYFFWGSVFFFIATGTTLIINGIAGLFLWIGGVTIVTMLVLIGIVKLKEFWSECIEAKKVRKWAEQKQKEADESLRYADEELTDEEIDIRIARYFQNKRDQ